MSDNTDDLGKPRPGDGPRRPHVTLDLKATEVDAAGGTQAATPGGSPGDPRTAPGAGALPPPPSPSKAGGNKQWLGGGWIAALAGGLAAGGGWAFRLVRNSAFLSHAAAGAAGAALTLAVAGLLGLLAGRQAVPPDVARRLAALEQAQEQIKTRPPALPAAVTDKLAAADKRLASLEDQANAIAALKSEQAKLAAETKALQARAATPELHERIAKLETALAALAGSAGAAGAPGADKLAARLAEVEKLSDEAGAARAAAQRLERDLATLKAETAGLRHGLEALKASVEEAIPAKLAGVERDLQAVKKTEGERVAGAQRVLLALEVANLKRALERGDSYARELEAAKKAAGGSIDLAALARSSTTGVPTLGALVQDFKRVSGAALDAEAEQPDASVLDRLMAGARTVVRLRKTHYTPDDTSAEATLARMEAALKDGNIGEALAQGKRLPPKAAAAAAPWLSRLEARYAADRAVAEIEAALKSSLAGSEPKR
jgi:hypothetical protein